MMKMNPLLLTDFYKTVHHRCYAPGLTKLVSYWTPRMTRKEGMNEVVMFGLQAFIKEYLIKYFKENFFQRDIRDIRKEYKLFISQTMGEDNADMEHIEALHSLGYLPIEISAVPEGTLVPIKVPMLMITNTHDDFAWLVNYIETTISCNIWQPMTSATIAYNYRELIDKYYGLTEDADGRKPETACGDFSMRGFSSFESAMASAAGHLLSFRSTATMGAILWLQEYYPTKSYTRYDQIATGTPSTEHSVMSSYGRDELECYRHLITEVVPKGPLSIVSDTYDYWNVLTDILPQLKAEIMNRDGKVIIRGDSGNPVDIICGEPVKIFNSEYEFRKDANMRWFYDNNKLACVIQEDGSRKYYHVSVENMGIPGDEDYSWKETEATAEVKGTVEVLWDIFGGTVNSKGYKVLDPHIGTIYGDSITIERCAQICNRLEQKGFSVSNCTFGIGSFTYQYNTRDTFGFALKATHAVFNGTQEKFIYKDPITDTDKFKKSQRGLCFVHRVVDDWVPLETHIDYKDELTLEELEKVQDMNLIQPVFRNGELLKSYSLEEVRDRLRRG